MREIVINVLCSPFWSVLCSISVYSLFKEVIIFCSLPFLYVEKELKNYDHQNPFTTACLILAIFLETSASHPIVREDSMNQGPLAIPQAVCPPDPTTVQQQFKECESTSDSKNPKKLGKRGISESTAEHGTQ